MEQPPSPKRRAPWWVAGVAAATAFILGIGASLVVRDGSTPRAGRRPPSASPSPSPDDRCARASPGSEEAERCKEASVRPDFGRPAPVTSLPAEFTAPCPGRFDKRLDREWATDPESLGPYRGPRREITTTWVAFESADGLTIPAYLAQPASGGPYPGVVWAHGGFFDDVVPETVDTIAKAGFVALGVAYRGSSGHGSELELAIDIAGKEVDDLAAGARFLQALPEVNGDAIGVAGGSHGGSLALSAAYRYQELFDVAADFYGVTDWACILTVLQPPGTPHALIQYSFGGTPADVPEAYMDRSAFYNAEDIDMPVYIAHGVLDGGIPPGESLKLVKALTSHGTPVTSRFYIGLDHGFLQREPEGSPIWGDFVQFLRTHLGEA